MQSESFYRCKIATMEKDLVMQAPIDYLVEGLKTNGLV
jgi:hypothetical protein